MGGLAALAKDMGHDVTGCDANVYPPMSTQLEALGIGLHEGFDAEQLDTFKADIYVVGNAMTRGKPIIEEILNRGLRYISGPQWLGENVLQGRWVLSVAGTHGKTTTSSMLAWILDYAGVAPGFLIGGIAKNFGISARMPKADSPFFVIEADEYDTAFFVKRSKFVHYHSRTVILNNLEYDHADIFPNIETIETQFHHLVRTVPANGLIVANGTEPHLANAIDKGCWTPIEYFGPGMQWDYRRGEQDRQFRVRCDEKDRGEVTWDLTGAHNKMNGLAAVAAARHAGVPVKLALEALNLFEGVARRMEVRGVIGGMDDGITVYDDFAHHPTAIATTLAGLRSRVNNQRIIAVLEPRSNTMKLGAMRNALPGSLANADIVFIYANHLGWDAAETFTSIGTKTGIFEDLDVLVAAVTAMAQPNDHVVVMSNGGFGGVHAKLLDALAVKAAKSGVAAE